MFAGVCIFGYLASDTTIVDNIQHQPISASGNVYMNRYKVHSILQANLVLLVVYPVMSIQTFLLLLIIHKQYNNLKLLHAE